MQGFILIATILMGSLAMYLLIDTIRLMQRFKVRKHAVAEQQTFDLEKIKQQYNAYSKIYDELQLAVERATSANEDDVLSGCQAIDALGQEDLEPLLNEVEERWQQSPRVIRQVQKTKESLHARRVSPTECAERLIATG